VISLAYGPSDGALRGTCRVPSVVGLATFTDLGIDVAGAGYVLMATSEGLRHSLSAPFDVRAGVPAGLAFSIEPGNGRGGVPLSPQPVIRIIDVAGNVVDTDSVTVSVCLEDLSGGAMLGGDTAIRSVDGIARFTDLRVDKSGTSYRLIATSSGLATAASRSFDVLIGDPTVLAVAGGGDQVGVVESTLGEPLRVAIRDAGGNAVPGVTVGFTVASAPAGAARHRLEPEIATTNSNGEAQSVFTLGDRPGWYEVVATTESLEGSPAVFVAKAREPDGTGTATIAPRRVFALSELTETITTNGDGRTTNAILTVEIPPDWSWTGDRADVMLSGGGFAGATAAIRGHGSRHAPYVIVISDTHVGSAAEGIVSISGLVAPSVPGVQDFVVKTASGGGFPSPIGEPPRVEVQELIPGDVSLDGSVDVLDLLWAIDFMQGRKTPNRARGIAADVYPARASREFQGPPDGRVDVLDVMLTETAILNGVWDDGTPLGSSKDMASGNSSRGEDRMLGPTTGHPTSPGEGVIIRFESSEGRTAVRMTNPMAVRGVQLNLRLSGEASRGAEIGRFARCRGMDVASKNIAGSQKILIFSQDGEWIEPGDGYVLWIHGGIDSYDISQTGVVIADENLDRTAATHGWDREWRLPTAYGLDQNRPNPFMPSTKILYRLSDFTKVTIDIFDIRGRRVRRLVDAETDPGVHTVEWDGTDQSGRRSPAGVYLYRMSAGDFVRDRKMLLVR